MLEFYPMFKYNLYNDKYDALIENSKLIEKQTIDVLRGLLAQ